MNKDLIPNFIKFFVIKRFLLFRLANYNLFWFTVKFFASKKVSSLRWLGGCRPSPYGAVMTEHSDLKSFFILNLRPMSFRIRRENIKTRSLTYINLEINKIIIILKTLYYYYTWLLSKNDTMSCIRFRTSSNFKEHYITEVIVTIIFSFVNLLAGSNVLNFSSSL